MHYYQFNIGDYASHTSRLSPMEDLSYRRILDLYYLNEQPLSGCSTDVAREIGLIDHVDSVEYVLGKFFTKDENVFRQKRIDIEIKKYKSNAKNKSKAGKASAKARKDKAYSKPTGVEQVLNGCATDEQLNINHKPITNNHKPITNLKENRSSRFTPPNLQDVIQYCKDRNNFVDAQGFIDHYESNGWMRGKTKIKCWKACIRTWEKNSAKPVAQPQERKKPRGFGE